MSYSSSEYYKILTEAKVRKRIYEDELVKKMEEVSLLKLRQTAIEEGQTFLQMVAKETQEQIRFRLEDIVNMALNAVFGPKYRFEIRFEIKRGQTEAALLLFDKDDNELDPLSSNGGGLSDVLSFALRIALLIISKNRRVLILDEPMKFVSADLRDACYDIMKKLSHELSIQIIAVTHEEEFIEKADVVYRARQREGICGVTLN